MENLISLALYGSSDRRSAELAEDLVAPLLGFSKIHALPVPLNVLLKAVHAKLEFVPLSDTEAKRVATLVRAKGAGVQFYIRCHDTAWRKNWRRLRFTIAHELGHILVLAEARRQNSVQKLARIINTPSGLRALESLCDRCASAILMPKQFLDHLPASRLSGHLLWELYDSCLVSWRVVITKVAQQLTNGPVVVLRKYARTRSEAHTYRVDWCYPSYRESPDHWLPRGCTLKHFSENVRKFCLSGEMESPLDEVTLRLGRVSRVANARMVRLTTRGQAQLQLPKYEGLEVQDERSFEQIVIFLSSAQ